MYEIFISYRRNGGFETAKHLYDLLIRDGFVVSFDIDTLREGDFDIQLLQRIDECDDFILIVDKNAFDKTLNPNTKPSEDWLRQELAYALKCNKNVIPVMLAGADFPQNLPDDICQVRYKNGPKYNIDYFDSFYERLKGFLKSRKSNKGNVFKFSDSFALGMSLAVYCMSALSMKDDAIKCSELKATLLKWQISEQKVDVLLRRENAIDLINKMPDLIEERWGKDMGNCSYLGMTFIFCALAKQGQEDGLAVSDNMKTKFVSICHELGIPDFIANGINTIDANQMMKYRNVILDALNELVNNQNKCPCCGRRIGVDYPKCYNCGYPVQKR